MQIAGAGGGGQIKVKPRRLPPGLALLAKEARAQGQLSEHTAPQLHPLRRAQEILHPLLHGAGVPPPTYISGPNKGKPITYKVQGSPVLAPVSFGIDALLHAADIVKGAHRQAVRVAHPSKGLRERDILGGLAAGAFGVAQMRVGTPKTVFELRRAAQRAARNRSMVNQQKIIDASRAIADPWYMGEGLRAGVYGKVKAVVPGAHGTNVPAVNPLNIGEGMFYSGKSATQTAFEKAQVFARARVQERGGTENVVRATLSLKNPLYLTAKADFASQDNSFAKIAHAAHMLANRGLITGRVEAGQRAGDVAINAASSAVNAFHADKLKTVEDLIRHYGQTYSGEEIQKILREAGYDSVVREQQGGGMHTVRPLNYSATVRTSHEPGLVTQDAMRKLVAFEKLLRARQAEAKTGKRAMSATQQRQLATLISAAQRKLALYRGADNPQLTYHGSQWKIDKYSHKRSQDSGLYGPGFYTTNDPEIAASYVDKESAHPYTLKNVRGREHVERLLRENPNLEYLGYRSGEAVPFTDVYNPALPPEYYGPGGGHEQGKLIPYEARFGDKSIGPNVRMQRIITKRPFDMRKEATFSDKRRILRALRDAFQQGKRIGNNDINLYRSTARHPYGSLKRLLAEHHAKAIYPPRWKSEYEGTRPNYHSPGLGQAAERSYFQEDRRGRREHGLAGGIMAAQDMEEIYVALQQHIADTRLINRIVQKAGYDAIRHEGGRVMGNKEHDVTIALRPAQIRHPQELPAAQHIMREALKMLAHHTGRGYFPEQEAQREFLRAYTKEAMKIQLGHKGLRTPSKQ